MTGFEMNLAQAAEAVGTSLPSGCKNIQLTGVSTDTRTLRPGELFVALRGVQFDGHEFVRRAFEAGAAAVLIDHEAKPIRGKVCLRAPDTLRALGDLAAWIRNRPGLKVAAITGSNGKTTTKEMLVAILKRRFRTLATKGNFNNLVGLPLTLFRLEAEHEAAILEMGMNAPGEIARLTEIAKPDVALITNVGPAHLEGLGSLSGVARAKGELFAGLTDEALAVVNLDDVMVQSEAERFQGQETDLRV